MKTFKVFKACIRRQGYWDHSWEHKTCVGYNTITAVEYEGKIFDIDSSNMNYDISEAKGYFRNKEKACEHLVDNLKQLLKLQADINKRAIMAFHLEIVEKELFYQRGIWKMLKYLYGELKFYFTNKGEDNEMG